VKSAGRTYLSGVPKSHFEFCIPTMGKVVPAGAEWFHEVKYDGYRLLVERDGDRVRLITRGGYDWTKHFPWIAELPFSTQSSPREAAPRQGDVSSAGISTPSNVITHDIRRADRYLTLRSTSRLHDLIRIHDSRLNVSSGILNISKSAATEPLIELPLQRTRAIESNVTLGQGNPVCQITHPYFGQRSEVGRDMEIDLEPWIDWTNVHFGGCTDQPPVAPARRDTREDELNRGAPGREVLGMHLAMYVPHQQTYIQFVIAKIGAVPSLTPLAQQVDDWRELPALLGEMIFRALAAAFSCHNANVLKLLQPEAQHRS
jgi:hypothetical protein